MYTRVEESDDVTCITSYQLAGAGVAMVITWYFLFLTFASERGGMLTLLLATVALAFCAALAEIRTSAFNTTTQALVQTRKRLLGPEIRTVYFHDIEGFGLRRTGTDKLSVETVSMHTKGQGDMDIGTYLVIKGEGGGLQEYLEGWLRA